jgi:dethiobiotin synthetase
MSRFVRFHRASAIRRRSSTLGIAGRRPRNIVFITGTDTGVGKTVLTALLLGYLRQQGCRALAMKPFCTGSRADVELLYHCQEGELSRDQINPFHFTKPVAPLAAARLQERKITLNMACGVVRAVSSRCDWLLVEGCGGLMVPLGRDYLVADWIAALSSPVLMVAPNRLGVVNHSLLTIRALQSSGSTLVQPVLMGQRSRDASCGTNLRLLTELLAPIPWFEVPYLGDTTFDSNGLKSAIKKTKKVLARVWASVILLAAQRQRPVGIDRECN